MSYLTTLLGQQSQIIEMLAAQQQQQQQRQNHQGGRKMARALRVTLLLVVVVLIMLVWILLPDVFTGNLRYVLVLIPVLLTLTIGNGKPALNSMTQSPFRRF